MPRDVLGDDSGGGLSALVIQRRPEDFGAARDGVQDDAAAITAAINDAVSAAQADGSNYCEVLFSSGGEYLAARAPVLGGATEGYAQIPLPVISASVEKVTLVLKGVSDAATCAHWQQTVPQRSGAVIRSSLTGATTDATFRVPSIIGGPGRSQGAGEFSNMLVVVDGLLMVAPLNPSVCALNFMWVAQVKIKSAAALANGTPSQISSNYPTNDQSGFGMIFPVAGNNDYCQIDSFECQGFYFGLQFADHTCVDRIALIYCHTPLVTHQVPGAPIHGATFQNVSAEAAVDLLWCISSGGKLPIFIAGLHNETSTGTTVIDTSNSLYGTIHYASNVNSVPTINGCGNLQLYDVNRARGQASAPAVPATTVAFVNPFFRDAAVTISGGTVTAIAVDGQSLGVTSGTIIVPTGKSVTLTYSVAPTWKWTLL